MVYVNNHNLVNAVNGLMASNPVMKTLFVNPNVQLSVDLLDFLAPIVMYPTQTVSVTANNTYIAATVPKGKMWRIHHFVLGKSSGTYDYTFMGIIHRSGVAVYGSILYPVTSGASVVFPCDREIWAAEGNEIVFVVANFVGAGNTTVSLQIQEFDV